MRPRALGHAILSLAFLICGCSPDNVDGTVPEKTDSGDGTVEEQSCGDGVLAPTESCDDGNTANDDGCDIDCSIEEGWTCDVASQPSVCSELPLLYISGSAMIHPLLAPVTGSDQVTIEGEAVGYAVLRYSDMQTLTMNVLDTNACGLQGEYLLCPYLSSAADTSEVTIGLYVGLDDLDNTATDDFFVSMTHVALLGEFASLAPGDTYDNFIASQVWTNEAVEALSLRIGEANGEVWAPGELACRGFTATAAYSAEGLPVQGFTADVGPAFSIHYYDSETTEPADMFKGAATDASGRYVIVPKLPENDDNGRCDPGEIAGGFYPMSGQVAGDVCETTFATWPGMAWNIPSGC